MLKNHAAKLFIAIGLAGGTVSLSGCSSPPSQREINETFRYFTQEIDSAFETLSAACGSLEGQAKQDCLNAAIEWHRTNRSLASSGWIDASNARWDAVRESRKLLEAELLQMLPNWPDIQNILTIQGVLNSDEGPGYPVYGIQPPPSGGPVGGPIGDPLPIVIETLSFTGIIAVMRDGVSDSAYCEGDIKMYFSPQSPDGLHAVISGGMLTAYFGNNEEVVLRVVKDSGNAFNTDMAGEGSMVFQTRIEHSMDEWDALLPEYQRLYLPLRFDTAIPGFVIDSADSDIDSVVPYVPIESSDYNLDNQLEYNSDFAAFLVGHNFAEDRSDMNKDSVWDQEDIDIWNIFFNLDQEQSLEGS